MASLLSLSVVLALSTVGSHANILDTAKANGCSKLVSLIETAGLADVLANSPNVTLFAPSDMAVDAIPTDVYKALSSNRTLLQSVLKFHALPEVKMAMDLSNDQLVDTFLSGSKLRTNVYNGGKIVLAQGSVVSKANLKASNGVVHVIDKVIYPIPSLSIPLLITFDKDLRNLGFLVYQANLISKLSEQSFTVFAPTNEAIEKIPAQEYNDLLQNFTELTCSLSNLVLNDGLQSPPHHLFILNCLPGDLKRDIAVLKLHVVPGTVYSAALSDGQAIKSLQGSMLNIKVTTDGVTVNGAKVQQTDMSANNGVIHVIDTILFPPKGMQNDFKISAPVVGWFFEETHTFLKIRPLHWTQIAAEATRFDKHL